MNLVNVTPLAQTTVKEELSYFTDRNLSEGAVVLVSIRNREVPALVVGKESVVNVKTRIKSSSYGLKKVSKVLTKKLYSADVIEAAKETSEFYAVSLGGVLKSATPKSVLENIPNISKKNKVTVNEMKSETSVLQLSRKERITFYKQYIRGTLARGKSIFICVPTKKEVEYLSEHLKKGIEHATLALHGGISAKASRQAWCDISNKEPKLIVSTGLFLSAINDSVETLILEREASDSYYSNKRPFFSLGYLAESLAKKSGIKFIAADSVLSVERYKKYADDKFTESAPIQKGYRDGADVSVIDMTEIMETEKKNKFLPLLSLSLLKEIAKSQKKHSFVFTARRGLSPTTTCSDCGFTFFCPECHSPLVLHEKKRKRIFICHTCGLSKEPQDECPKCGSWKLTQLGVGSERITNLLKKAFPNREVLRIDSDTANTVKKENDIWTKFKESTGSILVGTEMAINKILSDSVEIHTVGVASIDSLLTYPNYSSGEKVFRTLTELMLVAQSKLIIQTRAPEQKLLFYLKEKKLITFFQEELYLREKLFYPPFSIPVTVTFSAPKFKINEKESKLEEIFSSFSPIFFPSISERRRGLVVRKMLIRFQEGHWPDKEAVFYLKSLSPEYKVAVHPPTIV